MDAKEALSRLAEVTEQLSKAHNHPEATRVKWCVVDLTKAIREMRHSLIGEGWTQEQLKTAFGDSP